MSLRIPIDAPPPPPQNTGKRKIARAQEALNRTGAYLALTGSLDTATRRALAAFQKKNKLKITRKFDSETLHALGVIQSV